jgi:signal transduction histidine kinase/CheY-like chemotaxis protein
MELVASGLHALGDISWGSHFCHFYFDQVDLVDTLVPYFKAGLENNEQCLWVTSEPLLAHEARTLLKQAVPRLHEFEAKGQIEIINHHDWYLRHGKNDADVTLQSWVDYQYRALEKGYKGLRLTGNTYWLEKDDWAAFTEYEAKVNATFSRHRIVGLCSYCLSRAGSKEVFDVVRNHDFALLRQDGQWELLESVKARSENGSLQTLNRELKSSLKQAQKAAESASRLKTEFLANMSHEIRTPLGAILGFTDLLKEDDLSVQDKKEFIEVIQRNGTALSRLLDDILDIAKVEADMLKIEKVSFSPVELLEEIVAVFIPSTRMKSVTIRTDCLPGLPRTVQSDPTRLRQVLINLIGNAVKFTEKGTISIQVEFVAKPQPKIVFRIQDQGIGIQRDHQQSLFQPFNQADGSMTRRFGGTGLGLYLSRRLAQALDGDVILEKSAPGEGSVFVATIGVDAVELTAVSSAGENPAEPQRELDGYRLLIAEDLADNRLLIKHMLRSTGAQFTFAKDGREAVAMASADEFDLVLMDLQMPTMDGYSAVEILRKGGYRKPVIALSAHAMLEDRIKSGLAGFNGHITKPILREELMKTLKQFKMG